MARGLSLPQLFLTVSKKQILAPFRSRTASSQEGFTLIALMVTIAVMSVMLSMAVPMWDSVVRREQEEELIFRGEAIAKAIDCYATKFQGVPLHDLDVLVEQKCLRKAYKDPFDLEKGWRLLYTTLPPGAAALAGALQRSDLVFVEDIDPQQTPNARLIGVASRKDQDSFRIYNNNSNYHEWIFVAKSYTQLVSASTPPPVPTGFPPPPSPSPTPQPPPTGQPPFGGSPGNQPPQPNPFGGGRPGAAPGPTQPPGGGLGGGFPVGHTGSGPNRNPIAPPDPNRKPPSP